MEPIKLANVAAANAKSRRLRELVRAPEILVMPGAYDVLSALLFEQMGFKAIQGTSGGIAAALGYPDGEVMSRDLFVEITGKFAAAVSVPVNADGERGYGDENEIKETVRRLIAVGVAGMNLEDGAGGKPGGARGLVELSEQLRKIKAVMETKRALGSEFFLNARVDAFHVITTIQRRRWMKRFSAATPTRKPVVTVSSICSSIRPISLAASPRRSKRRLAFLPGRRPRV